MKIRVSVALLLSLVLVVAAAAPAARDELVVVQGTERVLWRQVLPNSLGPLIVQAILGIAGAILTASALSFLGVGVQPPAPDAPSSAPPRTSWPGPASR